MELDEAYPSNKLVDFLKKGITKDTLILSRNVGAGGASISIVVLAAILQMDDFTSPLKIAAVSLGASTPFWVCYFVCIEMFLYLDPKYYQSLDKALSTINLGALIASLGLLISICSLLWHISIWAGLAFITASIVALVMSGIIGSKLEHAISKYNQT